MLQQSVRGDEHALRAIHLLGQQLARQRIVHRRLAAVPSQPPAPMQSRVHWF